MRTNPVLPADLYTLTEANARIAELEARIAELEAQLRR